MTRRKKHEGEREGDVVSMKKGKRDEMEEDNVIITTHEGRSETN